MPLFSHTKAVLRDGGRDASFGSGSRLFLAGSGDEGQGGDSVSSRTTAGGSLFDQRGSHRQYRHATKPGRVTVSGNLGRDVPPGTLASILKQAGLGKG